ncbi:uncharacterized protein C1orf21 homolog isoform X1 [Gadus chalcogrammus]|uniref:Uncharacterized protein n=1 Tax=Gadus morhua TaxID=8049 RepID=A0A8C5B7E9_GADMO|nr:uncharacterized protein C1orf21 homolog isoform X1 [Gadus chalcogrammus]
MGCTSAKQVSAVPNGEDGRNKAQSNGEILSDEYRMKGAEQERYAGGEQEREDGQEDCTVRCGLNWCFNCFTKNRRFPVFRNGVDCAFIVLFECAQEKSALLGKGQHTEDNGSNGKILSIHSSESQQEFFRMLDEKIEKGQDYCSEGEDLT